MEALEQHFRLAHRLALQDLRHQGGGGHGDGAALADEGDVLDDSLAVGLQIDRQGVPAHGVVAVRRVIRILDPAQVPRVLAVVQDHFLVELSQFVEHQPKNSLTVWTASTSASISALVL